MLWLILAVVALLVLATLFIARFCGFDTVQAPPFKAGNKDSVTGNPELAELARECIEAERCPTCGQVLPPNNMPRVDAGQ